MATLCDRCRAEIAEAIAARGEVASFETLRREGVEPAKAAALAHEGEAALDTNWLREQAKASDVWAADVLRALVDLGVCHSSRTVV